MAYLGPSLRRTPRRSRPWRRALAALALSVLANALVLAGVRVGKMVGLDDARVPQAVSLSPLSGSQWEANRSVRPAAPAASSPRTLEAEQQPPPTRAPGQVVDVAPSKDSTPPKDTRFVSDRNNTVEKETRSRYAKAGYPNTLPRPSDGKPPPPHPAPAPELERAISRQVAKGAPGRRGGQSAPPGTRSQAGRERLALNLDAKGDLRLREPKPEVRGTPGSAHAGGSGDAGEGPGALDRIQLHPSASVYDRLAGGPAPDHLEGVEEGEGTYLNTREWKYATYFNRIKQAVATQWDPLTPLRQRDPNFQRFAYKDRITVLSVKLDDSGALRGLNVAKSSGVDFLDRSAVEAFQKAQPFVNPPRGLADGHGEIAFTFGFVVEGGGFRIFRGPTQY